MSDRRFNLEITTGHLVLTTDEIWPDGNGPANPTAEDVLELVNIVGARDVIRDWFLDGNMQVYCSDVKPRLATVAETAAEATP